MLKTISSHIKDLYFVKQILYGFTGWVVARDLNDVYINAFLSASNIEKYNANIVVIGKTIHEVCDKKVANYYKYCGQNAINADNIFISKKLYTTLGEEHSGLLYFYPYKNQQNDIIGCVSYNIDIACLKNTAIFLFDKSNIKLKKLYPNLPAYQELFSEIIKIIDQINLKQVIHNNNVILIQHLKNYLNILLKNLKQVHQILLNNNFSL